MRDDQYNDETLSDNTHADYCRQCKDCAMWGIGNDPFSNAYDKSCCAMYPYPGIKPPEVIRNSGLCQWKVER